MINLQINIPNNEVWLPIIGFLTVVFAIFRNAYHKKLTKSDIFAYIAGVLIMALSINDNKNKDKFEKSTTDSIASLHRSIYSLKDTIRDSRDSLKKIGLRIDERTGQIQVIDSQILKEVMNTKFLLQRNNGLPDSVNFSYSIKKDTLTLSPKEGTWVKFYFYTDTAYFSENERNSIINEGMSDPNPEQIKIKNKVYVVNLNSLYERAVTPNKPVRLNLNAHPNQAIIFGDQSVLTKRYFYKNGKVNWIPE